MTRKESLFFAKGTFEIVKWLPKRRLALYGDSTGGGNLGSLINLIGKHDCSINKYLLVKKTDVYLVNLCHPRDISFCVKEM